MTVPHATRRATAKQQQVSEAVDAEHAVDRTSSADVGIELERIIPYVANRLTFRLNQLLKQDLKPFGLSIVEWRVLAVLAANETATINEIANYAMLEQPTASRLLLRMEEDKLIERNRDAVDGRVRSISLTPLGHKRHQEARSTVLAHTDRAIDGLSDAECQQLKSLILRMTANLETAIKSVR